MIRARYCISLENSINNKCVCVCVCVSLIIKLKINVCFFFAAIFPRQQVAEIALYVLFVQQREATWISFQKTKSKLGILKRRLF